jgi:DNA-binding response OmpR family regulator
VDTSADRRQRVLVVDDDADLRAALQEVLEDAGFEVSSARDGADACRQLSCSELLPDLLVVDLFMPVLDGWGLVRALRGDEVCASIPVIVMTAAGASVLATAPVAAGYVTKPINLDMLLAMIRRTLSMRAGGGLNESGTRARPSLWPAAVSHDDDDSAAS